MISPQENKPQTSKPNGNFPKPDPNNSKPDYLRVRDAVLLSAIGLILALILIVILIRSGWNTASDIVAVIGPFTTLIGTLVGLIIGGGVGSQGRASAEQRATASEQRALAGEKKAQKYEDFNKSVRPILNKYERERLAPETMKPTEDLQKDLKYLADLRKEYFE